MKKGLFLVLIISLLTACSSSGTPKSLTTLRHVFYHTAPSKNDEASILFGIYSQTARPKVSLISLNGTHVDELIIKELKEEPNFYEGETFKGMYMGWYSIIYSIPASCRDDIVISSVTLSIDGEEKEYEFRFPIIKERESLLDKKEKAVALIGGALLIFGSSIPENQIYDQTFYCKEPIEVLSYGFNDFLYMSDVKLSITRATSNDCEEVSFPVRLESGDKLNISFSAHYKEEIGADVLDYITCSSVLTYQKTSDGIEESFSSPFIVQGVINEEAAGMMVDLLLKEQSDSK